MASISGKKGLALCVLSILEKYSSKNDPLTSARIIKLLKSEFGMDAGRNAVARNIAMLREMGYEISTYDENNRGAYIVLPENEAGKKGKGGRKPKSMALSDEDVMLLTDALFTSRSTPAKDAERLVELLVKHGSSEVRERIPAIRAFKEWDNGRGYDIFDNLFIINKALKGKKQLEFLYNTVGMGGELKPMRMSKEAVNPHEIVCAMGQYYLIASSRSYSNNLRNYRVDRMSELAVLNEAGTELKDLPGFENGLDLNIYSAEHSFGYGGRSETVVLRMPRLRAGYVVDAFGESAVMEDVGNGYMEVTIHSSLEGMRFLALQFGPGCEVIKPEKLRATIKADIEELRERYSRL